MSNEPVAWWIPEHKHPDMVSKVKWSDECKPLYTRPVDDTALPRLLRIMGTFDLATGHASTMDEALDELESELRDVLGYYRTAKPDDTALLRQALEALERAALQPVGQSTHDAITALRERLKGTE